MSRPVPAVAPAPERREDAEARVRAALATVCDPEIPVLTVEDLGVLRDVRVGEDGSVEVTVTPTYSGCPAMDVIRSEVEAAARREGFTDVRVTTVLSPAWTTDWMSDVGRRKLAEYGIAPPTGRAAASGAGVVTQPVHVPLSVRCPQCGSLDTREVSRFGSTACKALYTCRGCLEPFDSFKVL